MVYFEITILTVFRVGNFYLIHPALVASDFCIKFKNQLTGKHNLKKTNISMFVYLLS